MVAVEKKSFDETSEDGSRSTLKTINEQPNKVFKLPPHLPKNASDFRIFIYEVTESKAFGGAILFVILLNTVILVAQTSEDLVMRGGK